MRWRCICVNPAVIGRRATAASLNRGAESPIGIMVELLVIKNDEKERKEHQPSSSWKSAPPCSLGRGHEKTVGRGGNDFIGKQTSGDVVVQAVCGICSVKTKNVKKES